MQDTADPGVGGQYRVPSFSAVTVVCLADQAFELGETWLSRGSWERAVPHPAQTWKGAAGTVPAGERHGGFDVDRGKGSCEGKGCTPKKGPVGRGSDQPVSLL